MNTKNKNMVIVMPPSVFLFNKYQKKYNTTYRLRAGEMVAVAKDGSEVPLSEIEKIFPTPDQLFFIDNSDRTKNYLTNRKIY